MLLSSINRSQSRWANSVPITSRSAICASLPSESSRSFLELIALIGELSSKGASADQHHYEVMDFSPLPGSNRYRLKSVHKDGSAEYSHVVEVMVDENDLAVYPNPFSNTISIRLPVILDREVKVALLDATGKEVYRDDHYSPEGKIDLMGNWMNNLTAGVYLLKVSSYSQGTHRYKLIKQ